MTIQDRIKRIPDAQGAPLRGVRWVLPRHTGWWAILAVAIAVLAGFYIVHSRNSAAAQAPATVTATRDDVENVVSAVGNLQPVRTVDVGSQVTGQLKKLYVKIGDDVTQGQPVAVIDSTVAAAKVEADDAQLQNLQAQLADKQSSLVLDTAEAGRQTGLKKAGATSQTTYDGAIAALRSARAQVKAVEAQITEAQSTLKADQATVGYAEIAAPMSGTVTNIAAKERMPSGPFEHFTDEGGRCRLSVGPGHGDNREVDLPPRPLEFPDYLYSPPARLLKGFDVQRNPGADDYAVCTQKIFEAVVPQAKRATGLLDGIQRAVEFRAGAQVRCAHFCPTAPEQSAYGPARYPKSDHERFFGGLFGSHSHSPAIASTIFSIAMLREPFTSTHAPSGTTRRRKSTASA